MKKILIILVLLVVWMVNPISTNDEPHDNWGKEAYISCETAGFYKPNNDISAGYHITPQKCQLLDQVNGWAKVQLNNGTVCYVPAEVLK